VSIREIRIKAFLYGEEFSHFSFFLDLTFRPVDLDFPRQRHRGAVRSWPAKIFSTVGGAHDWGYGCFQTLVWAFPGGMGCKIRRVRTRLANI
jgi:hypothetical protein